MASLAIVRAGPGNPHLSPLRIALVFVAVSSVAGCQCFEPVGESGEAGSDGGRRDAGVIDAGPCSLARDCAGPIATTRACGFSGGGDAGFSCIQGNCIAECGATAGRTCKWGDASNCLFCAEQTCTSGCPTAFLTSLMVEDLACRIGVAPWAAQSRFNAGRAAGTSSCDFALENAAAGLIGRVRFLANGEVQADLPALGGLCVGSMLPTGLLRIVLSCPRCQVMFVN